LLVLSIIIVVGFTIWTYRRTIPPVSPLLRGVLVFLRAFALILICFLFFAPVLHLTFHEIRQAAVGLLIDTSSSMQISEGEKTRGDIARELLRSGAVETLRHRFRLLPYLFAENAQFVEPLNIDSLVFDGTATDIAQALQMIQEARSDAYIGGILLFSDGAYNSGEDPLSVGEHLGCPVYAVAIGETKPKPDVLISRLLTHEITYVENRVPVEVSLKGPEFAGRRVSVRLSKGQKVVDRSVVTVPSDGLETSVRLHYTAEQPGFQKMTVDVDRLEGEITFANNLREFYVRVLKSKLNVLLVADAPSPDLAFIKRLLLADESIFLMTRTQRQGAVFYEGAFPSPSEWSSIDMVILLGLPSQTTDPAIWDRLMAVLQTQKKPFLIVTTKRTDLQKIQSIDDLLPFHRLQKTMETSIIPRLTTEGRVHPVMRIDERWEVNASLWNRLPPLFSNWISAKAKPGCQELALGISQGGALSAQKTEMPFIFARHVGDEKSVAVLGYGLYRWDLLMWGTGGTHDVIKGFLSNTVRWLVTREEENPVRLSTNKTVYRSGEEVFLTAQVYDEMYRPVTSAQVTARILAPSGSSTLRFTDAGEGRYVTTARLYESGAYQIEAEAVVQDRSVGRDSVALSVSSFNPEFLDTKANPRLLDHIATLTSGRFGPPDSLGSIVDSMRFPEQTVHTSREIELAHLPGMLILIVILLCLEWFIRKRRGMV